MLVGEQPGDQEDVQGRPFVGPSGQLLEDLLEKAGLARSEVYVTNAVKHFKWEARGKRRLHAKPSARELKACHPWLKVEIEVVRPQTIVCLGATAAQSILGASFRITRERGKLLPHAGAGQILATYHPSAILRAPDHDARLRMRAELVDDLRIAAVSIQPKRR
jgi:DNA polymerase